jgi:hypothetical protein
MSFYLTGTGHPIMGGLLNGGNVPIDGNNTVAVLPLIHGACNADLTKFFILDTDAIRIVDMSMFTLFPHSNHSFGGCKSICWCCVLLK